MLDLQRQFETANQQREQLYSQVSQLQSQLENTNQERSGLDFRVLELQNNLDTINHERARLETRFNELQIQFETANQERTVQEATLTQLYSQVSALQSQLEKVTQECAPLQTQLLALQSQLDSVSQEREQLYSQLSQLPSQRETLPQEDTQIQSSVPKESQLVKKFQPEEKVSGRSGLIVCQEGSGDYSTIGEAIAHAKPGTHIFIRPGVYKESLVIDKPLEIIGDGPLAEIIIESEDSNCLLMQTDQALVRGITFSETGRHYTVNIPQGKLILEECDLTANSNYTVVAIGGSTANPIIRRCQIHDGKWNGIWVSNNARGTVENCEIFDNGSSGIGIGQGANLIIRGCQINWNGGKAIAVYNKGNAIVEDCDLTDNASGSWDIEQGGYVQSSRNKESDK
ncbi:MAG TPA: hypothetical protein DCE56_01790 [Cyanobacteria bacterium UBA8553]|nr:hypothetical protein [Cyanobacteria bacterium UBA8553]